MQVLLHGVGLNDADYQVSIRTAEGISTCPYYSRWRGMLQRCYSSKFLARNPAYAGCYVVEEWHSFMRFKSWMNDQNWQGRQIDKDILIPGNRAYGPDSCVFVTGAVNKFLIDRSSDRGAYPVGVYFNKPIGKFMAQCSEVETGKKKTLGVYDDPVEAHKAWLSFKIQQARILAAQQDDPRVAKALIDRYENYCIGEAMV